MPLPKVGCTEDEIVNACIRLSSAPHQKRCPMSPSQLHTLRAFSSLRSSPRARHPLAGSQASVGLRAQGGTTNRLRPTCPTCLFRVIGIATLGLKCATCPICPTCAPPPCPTCLTCCTCAPNCASLVPHLCLTCASLVPHLCLTCAPLVPHLCHNCAPLVPHLPHLLTFPHGSVRFHVARSPHMQTYDFM